MKASIEQINAYRSVLKRMLLKLVTGKGERGTGNGERVFSGNPPENSKWRTEEKIKFWPPVLNTRSMEKYRLKQPDGSEVEEFTLECWLYRFRFSLAYIAGSIEIQSLNTLQFKSKSESSYYTCITLKRRPAFLSYSVSTNCALQTGYKIHTRYK